jgi:hypothetical protein
MASVQSKGLQDVLEQAVPLQDPNYRRVANDKTIHPDSAILVDLAIHEESVCRVLLKYGLTGFAPISHEDPGVLSQCGDKIEDRQIAANKNMFQRDSHYLHKECRLLTLWP